MPKVDIANVPKYIQQTFINPRRLDVRWAPAPRPRLDRIKKNALKLNPSISVERIEAADDFAMKKLWGRRRQSGLPAWVHARGTSHCLVSLLGLSEITSIESAFNHDTMEDAEVTPEELEAVFNEDVSRIIQGVTNLKTGRLSQAAQGHQEILHLLSQIQGNDLRIGLVRLADRLHNMFTIEGMKKKAKIKAKAEETLHVQTVLADAYGARMVRDLLYDLCLRVLEPRIFSQIYRWIRSNLEREGKAAAEVKRILEERYSGLGIEADVFVRPKSIYKLYQEMERRGLDQPHFDALDTVGVVTRVSRPDIYNTLNVIHAPPFEAIPGTFFDNLNNPLWNGLERVKTTVSFGDCGRLDNYVCDPRNELISRWGIVVEDYLGGGNWWQRELPAVETMLKHAEASAPEQAEQEVSGLRRQKGYINSHGDLVYIKEDATVADVAILENPEKGIRAKSFRVDGNVVPPSFTFFRGKKVSYTSHRTQEPGFAMWGCLKTQPARAILRKYFESKDRNYAYGLGRGAFRKRLRNEMHNILEEIEADKEFISELLGFLRENGYRVNSMYKLFYDLGAGNYDFEEIWKACVEFYKGLTRKLHGDKSREPKIYSVRMIVANQPGETGKLMRDIGRVFINVVPGMKTRPLKGDPDRAVFEFSVECYFEFQKKQIERIVKERGILIT